MIALRDYENSTTRPGLFMDEVKKYSMGDIVSVLKKGGTILYPTDTIWGIGCDATNGRAVETVYRIKERISDKSFILLVKDMDMLKRYVVEVPDIAVELLSSVSEPLTIIYPKGKNLPKNVVAENGSVAIRIPRHDFCQELLDAFDKPITSTSANIAGGPIPYSYRSVLQHIKESVDYVVHLEQDSISRPKPSTIVKIDTKGDIRILRN